jgi:hypothetical protein
LRHENRRKANKWKKLKTIKDLPKLSLLKTSIIRTVCKEDPNSIRYSIMISSMWMMKLILRLNSSAIRVLLNLRKSILKGSQELAPKASPYKNK